MRASGGGHRAGPGRGGRARSGATGDAPAGAGTCPERRRGGAPPVLPLPSFGVMPAGRGMRRGCGSTRWAAGSRSSPCDSAAGGRPGDREGILEKRFSQHAPGSCGRLGALAASVAPGQRQARMEAAARSKSLTLGPSPNALCDRQRRDPARPRCWSTGHRHLPWALRSWSGLVPSGAGKQHGQHPAGDRPLPAPAHLPHPSSFSPCRVAWIIC
ncbi:uncharacterized protein LOC129125369 [Agelaius phoeniceus]|uniref:uncharacterized protein LOC129125369 n=1 Tax=Agelaius phoeniceus TaxID=39638 RepID=UPI004054A8DC